MLNANACIFKIYLSKNISEIFVKLNYLLFRKNILYFIEKARKSVYYTLV